MKLLGLIVLAVGALILAGAFGMDTAPDGTHNIGLLQQQLMIFQLGGIVASMGVLAATVGIVLGRLEVAGILPPSGFKGSLPARPAQTSREE